jgi:hypothetical protein
VPRPFLVLSRQSGAQSSRFVAKGAFKGCIFLILKNAHPTSRKFLEPSLYRIAGCPAFLPEQTMGAGCPAFLSPKKQWVPRSIAKQRAGVDESFLIMLDSCAPPRFAHACGSEEKSRFLAGCPAFFPWKKTVGARCPAFLSLKKQWVPRSFAKQRAGVDGNSAVSNWQIAISRSHKTKS